MPNQTAGDRAGSSRWRWSACYIECAWTSMFSDVPGSVWNERNRYIPVRPFRSAWGLSNHQRTRLLLGWRNEPAAAGRASCPRARSATRQAFEEAPRHKPHFQHADYGIRGSPPPSAVPAQSASRLPPRLSQSPNTLPRYWGTDEEESPLLKGERVNER